MRQAVIPLHVFERLEREWRVIEPEREPKDLDKQLEKQIAEQRGFKRLRVGRVD
ncbi:hypothetical protein [Neorhizobium sp. P12A]|uniref:hypothetical protein n=1 Tax=Neorhizobium sp. P12A TaxID=2268027 RepID=UPI00165DDEF4|nr:hypothetical protein [Neorhizobium sp. P12A]